MSKAEQQLSMAVTGGAANQQIRLPITGALFCITIDF